jgi:hypothetical protein
MALKYKEFYIINDLVNLFEIKTTKKKVFSLLKKIFNPFKIFNIEVFLPTDVYIIIWYTIYCISTSLFLFGWSIYIFFI